MYFVILINEKKILYYFLFSYFNFYEFINIYYYIVDFFNIMRYIIMFVIVNFFLIEC